jgi:hypothetical protein
LFLTSILVSAPGNTEEKILKITQPNIAVPTTEIKDPRLETKFQPAYESGKSGILLGIPANPKKC